MALLYYKCITQIDFNKWAWQIKEWILEEKSKWNAVGGNSLVYPFKTLYKLLMH